MSSHRSGTVALVGRPNSGKSTLLNRVLGAKVSIVSHKPQTTRNRVAGIHTGPGFQVVLLDTPGLHAARGRLNEAMVRAAASAIAEADAVCWVVDGERAVARAREGREVVHEGLSEIARAIEEAGRDRALVVALNKVDAVERPWLLPVMGALADRLPAATVIPVSARTGDGLDPLVAAWVGALPERPAAWPEDQLAIAPERFVVAELIREKVFRLTDREIPYATAVEVERFEEEPGKGDARGRVTIHARVFVERDSQKGILIGKGGQMLKRIGTDARRDIQRLLGARVHLELFVAVEPDWSRNPRVLRELGIE